MKKISFLLMLITVLVIGCSEEVKIPESCLKEGEAPEISSISVSLTGSKSLEVGKEASFTVKDDRGNDVTSDCKIFVEGEEIAGGKYTPEERGQIEVYATYKSFTSPKITLEVKGNIGNIKSIRISTDEFEIYKVGEESSFIVLDDADNDITSDCKIFVAGKEIAGSTYTPDKEGEIEVYATYKNLISPKITIEVEPGTNTGGTEQGTYTAKALIHDFTGTWCGHCADAIYEIEKLHEKYPKNVIPVGVHSGSGPDNDGSFDYEKYKDFGVKGNPIYWFNNKENAGNLEIFTEEFMANKKETGLAINYDLNNDKVTVKVHSDQFSNNIKIVVYVVEDKLIADQANYSNNDKNAYAYKKGDPIPNMEHNNVLRTILTEMFGDAIPTDEVTDNSYTVTYSLTGKKGKIKEIKNTKIIAFVVDSKGNSLNAQIAKANEDKDFD